MGVNTTQTDPNTWIVACSGKLDFQARHDFQNAVAQTESTSPRKVILDLGGVTHVDSAGLGLLTLAHKKLSPQGIQIVIANAQNSARDVLLLTNMDKLFPLYASVAEASQAPHTPITLPT